jgi:hypothetical protein
MGRLDLRPVACLALSGARLVGYSKKRPRAGQRMSTAEIALRSAVQSAARTAGTKIGQAILRGILGGKSKK